MVMNYVASFLDGSEVFSSPELKTNSGETDLGLSGKHIPFSYDHSYYEWQNQSFSEEVVEPKPDTYENKTLASLLDNSSKLTSHNNGSPLSLGKSATTTPNGIFRTTRTGISQLPRKYPSKRFKPEPSLENKQETCDDLTEQAKLERNRICARECRERKKVYLKSLELQIKDLQKEVQECRKELNKYKQKEQEEFFTQFNNQGAPLNYLNPAITNITEISTNNRLELDKYIVIFIIKI